MKTLKRVMPSATQSSISAITLRPRVGDRHVEAVVDVGGAVGAAVPLLARVLQRPADVLDDEVDDARRPAGGGGRGTRVVVLAAPGAAERHREVRVVVDQPRQDKTAGGVDLLVGRQAGSDGDDGLPVDQHVGVERVGGGDDPPTADEPPHTRRLCHPSGRDRPVSANMDSVWEYPRPPAVVPCDRRAWVALDGKVVADSRRALRVLETSHPPVIYIPAADVRPGRLMPSRAPSTWCEFKGRARYLDARGGRQRRRVDVSRSLAGLRGPARPHRVLSRPRRGRVARRRARATAGRRLLRRVDHRRPGGPVQGPTRDARLVNQVIW